MGLDWSSREESVEKIDGALVPTIWEPIEEGVEIYAFIYGKLILHIVIGPYSPSRPHVRAAGQRKVCMHVNVLL